MKHKPECKSFRSYHKSGFIHYETDANEPCPEYHYESGKCDCGALAPNDPVRVLQEQNAESRLHAMDRAQRFLDANPDLILPTNFTELKCVIADAFRNVQMANPREGDK